MCCCLGKINLYLHDCGHGIIEDNFSFTMYEEGGRKTMIMYSMIKVLNVMHNYDNGIECLPMKYNMFCCIIF